MRPLRYLSPILFNYFYKIYSDYLCPTICNIISYSLNSGTFPQHSGFRRGHSTETALLNVTDVITSTLNTNNCCQLVMLDISSTFDTLDHQIILSRIHLLGVRYITLLCFTSYLSDRSSSVKLYNSLSSPSPMKYGVPIDQYSILYFSLFIYIHYHT